MYASLRTAVLRFGCRVASQDRSPRDVREPGDSSAEVWAWVLRIGVLGMYVSLGTAALIAESEVWVWEVPES